MRSVVVATLVLASWSAAAQPVTQVPARGVPVATAHPAWRVPFANASFEDPDLAGFSLALTGSTPISASARKTAARTTVASQSITIGGQLPARLGGDYWKVPFPISDLGQNGAYWLQAVGVLTTPPFTLTSDDRFLTFLLKTSGHGTVDVSLIAPDRSVILRQHLDHTANARMIRVSIPLASIPAARRANVRVMLPLQTSDAVDDFALTTSDPIAMLGAGGGAGSAGTASNVWGMADLHAHLFNHMGFGGTLIAGSIHSSIGRAGLGTDLYGAGVDREASRRKASNPAAALPDCYPVHGHSTIAGGDSTLTVEPEGGHDGAGYPRFTEWPRYTSKSHQQAYVDWLKRAWEGGLRLVHVDVGNEKVIADALADVEPKLGPLGFTARGHASSHEDAAAIEAQVQAVKDFVTLPDVSPWAEIALTPADARRIIGQGKLALVLGTEVEDACPYHVEDTETTRRADIHCIDHLYALGIRHIIPIHTTNNSWGGAAAYDMFLMVGQAVLRGHLFTMHNVFADGVRARPDLDAMELQKLRDFSIGSVKPFDIAVSLLLGSNAATIVDEWRRMRTQFEHDPRRGLANDRGLSDAGKFALQYMMKLGMVIDLDHMSDLSIHDTLDKAQLFDYPVIFSHTGFRELSWGSSKVGSPPQRDGDGFERIDAPNTDTELAEGDANMAILGTAAADRVATERDHTATQLATIRQLGGMVGVGTGAASIPHPYGHGPAVAPCDGTATAFASEYLYAVEKMGGRGVAIGTDINGLNGLAGPRFGPYACWAASADKERSMFLRLMVDKQKSPVRYGSTVVKNYGTPRFSPGAAVRRSWSDEELLAWEAIATFKAGAQTTRPGDNIKGDHENKVKWIAWGLHVASTHGAHPHCTDLVCLGEWDWAGGAYEAVTNAAPVDGCSMCAHNATVIRSVLARWAQMDAGTNEPLAQPTMTDTSGRVVSEWNFNLDGFAHYGLLPDFIQDAKNVGLTPQDLTPLFHSAEDYIEMWEKIENRKLRIP